MMSGDSEADFERARRAVEFGWLRVEDVEAALLEADRDPSRGLLDRLPLDEGQREALEHPLPAEVAEAYRDPSNRVGKYVLVRHLKSGGMGRVFKAWDRVLGRWAALKFVRRPEDARARAWFEREARLAASLVHPHAAAVYDTGDSPKGPWIAFQYVDGSSLAGRTESMEPSAAAELIRAAADAVAAAHGRGIIHRDLKPANLMVDRDGRVFVLDFGLAKSVEEETTGLSGAHEILGTPEYMPPEQARGELRGVGREGDVYALGACLYELLAGRPPFRAATRPQVLARVMSGPPEPLGEVRPGVPAGLEAIVRRCMDPNPARRYASAAGLREDLERYLRGERPLARRRQLARRFVQSLGVMVAIGLAFTMPMLLASRSGEGVPERIPDFGRLQNPRQVMVDGGEVWVIEQERGARERRRLLSWKPGEAVEERLVLEFPGHQPISMAKGGGMIFLADPNGAPGTCTEILGWVPGRSPSPIYQGRHEKQPLADAGGLAYWRGQLYAADQVGGRVFRMNPDGSALERFSDAYYAETFKDEHLQSLATDGESLFLVGAGRAGASLPRVAVWNTGSTGFSVLHEGAPLVRPVAVAVGDRDLYLADPGAGNAVWRMRKQGGPVERIAAGPPFLELSGIAWDRGILYLADTGNTFDGGANHLDGPGAVFRLPLPSR